MSGPAMNAHEQAFVEAFIDPVRRERYLSLLASPKRRQMVLERLNHQLDLRADLEIQVLANATDSGIVAALRDRRSPEVSHIIADASDRDGMEFPLVDSIAFATIHPFGVIISCIPGRLACYKAESPSPLFLLERKKP